MSKLIDLTGQKFGELTVLRRATKKEILENTHTSKEDKHAFWWVECSCGAQPFVVIGKDLRAGKTKSCGHLRYDLGKQKIKDLTGQQFGKLKVIYFIGIKNHRAIWHCKCDCGNEKNISSTDLISGHTKSCGCLHQEILGQGHPKDLTGQQFGYLIPLYITDKRTNDQHAIWRCKCLTCGNEKDISSHTLSVGQAISCGCIQSKGETKIYEILKNNNIQFEQQKIFDSCISNITNKQLRFDFYINNQYIIEYDGEQHFYSTSGWNTETSLKKVQYRDNLKNQWCKENNIPLIRIPYTQYDKLCLEDLLLETSQFIVI